MHIDDKKFYGYLRLGPDERWADHLYFEDVNNYEDYPPRIRAQLRDGIILGFGANPVEATHNFVARLRELANTVEAALIDKNSNKIK